MITVFFNEDGYYISGNGVDMARRCSPALTDRGDRIFQTIHHEYKILYLALCELRGIDTKHDVIVYNNSRIIDEINGNIEPLDENCSEWLKTLKRNVIPHIKSVVFFRKKPSSFIKQNLEAAHESMLALLDRRTRERIAAIEVKAHEERAKNKKRRIIERLRQSWFNTNGD